MEGCGIFQILPGCIARWNSEYSQPGILRRLDVDHRVTDKDGVLFSNLHFPHGEVEHFRVRFVFSDIAIPHDDRKIFFQPKMLKDLPGKNDRICL